MGIERETSRAHCGPTASTRRTPFSRCTDVARWTAGPTAAFHANVTFPADSGASRSSAAIAPGTTEPIGFMNSEVTSDCEVYHPAVRLILASASPRRAELLRAAGFVFDIMAVDIDERVRAGERPEDYVRRLAMEKSARGPYERDVVLAADTAVVVDGEILGKPADAEESRRMLELLSGREHRVLTGLSLRRGTLELGGVESTSVWFSPLSRPDIDWYVDSGEGRDKAGGYAIQGLASRFIPRIDGSYSNVVGLPLHHVAKLITGIGYAPPDRGI